MPINKEFRKFETFDLKEGEKYTPSTSDNNYNNPDTGTENFLVGYHTGDKNTLSGRNEFKIRLQDVRGIYYGSTAYWNDRATYVPMKGEVFVYTDGETYENDGKTVLVPLMKIGTGEEYLGQLPFVGKPTRDLLAAHIADEERHVKPGEREKWNRKLNIDPERSVHYSNETIYFNRD